MSNPGFYFYPGDWLKDTRVLSLQCRGAWIDLLGELNEHGGSVSWTIPDYARFWGCSEDVASDIIRDLSRLKTAFVTDDGHGVVTVMSRRLSREIKTREDAKLRKQEERERRRVTEESQPDVTGQNHSSSYPSPSPSLNPLKIKHSSLEGFEAFWKAYPRKVGKGAARSSWRKIASANGTGEKILQAVKQQKSWKAWKEGFIPLPATWLNQTRWEDEGLQEIKSNNPFAD